MCSGGRPESRISGYRSLSKLSRRPRRQGTRDDVGENEIKIIRLRDGRGRKSVLSARQLFPIDGVSGPVRGRLSGFLRSARKTAFAATPSHPPTQSYCVRSAGGARTDVKEPKTVLLLPSSPCIIYVAIRVLRKKSKKVRQRYTQPT